MRYSCMSGGSWYKTSGKIGFKYMFSVSTYSNKKY